MHNIWNSNYFKYNNNCKLLTNDLELKSNYCYPMQFIECTYENEIFFYDFESFAQKFPIFSEKRDLFDKIILALDNAFTKNEIEGFGLKTHSNHDQN